MDPKDVEFEKMSKKMLASYMTNVKIKMYLYILNADSLPPKLYSANPNPYVLVKLGNKEISVILLLVSSKTSPRRTPSALTSACSSRRS
jgi:hypothetical protein